MSVAEAQARVEIFRGPGFADDNFAKAWSLITGGSSSFSTDGDIVTVNSGDQSAGTIEKSFTGLSSDSYPRIQFKVTDVNGTWVLSLYDGSSWDVIASGTSPALLDVALLSGKTYSKIRLTVEGGTGKTAKFDYVFICKNQMLIPTDVTHELTITRPLLEMGVAGANLALPNNGGLYTGLITQFDRILIYLWRVGASMKKAFGGVISDYAYKGNAQTLEYYLTFECMDLGQQLLAPEALLTKMYKGVNGRTIIKECINTVCGQLTDLFVDVDNDIVSTHDIMLEDAVPYSTILEICKKATTVGGIVGFDSYVDPAGNVHVFARNKYTSTVDLTDKISDYERKIQAHRIENKINVYGKKELLLPTDGDAWTESDTTGWSCRNAAGTPGTVGTSTSRKVGSYSINCVVPSGGGAPGHIIKKTFPQIKILTRDGYDKLHLWAMYLTVYNALWSLRILAPDEDNYFWYDCHGVWMGGDVSGRYPTEHTINLANFDSMVGSPDITNVQGFILYFYVGPGVSDYTYTFDNVYFAQRSYRGYAQNSVSIGKYGARYAESQTDEELKSDHECEQKAESLIEFLKEPVESINLTVLGNNGFVPGDKLPVVISNDALSAYYRILEARYVVRDVRWDALLKLSNEPKIIDYIHASTASPRYAGATVIIPRDFSTIHEGINAIAVS